MIKKNYKNLKKIDVIYHIFRKTIFSHQMLVAFIIFNSILFLTSFHTIDYNNGLKENVIENLANEIVLILPELDFQANQKNLLSEKNMEITEDYKKKFLKKSLDAIVWDKYKFEYFYELYDAILFKIEIEKKLYLLSVRYKNINNKNYIYNFDAENKKDSLCRFEVQNKSSHIKTTVCTITDYLSDYSIMKMNENTFFDFCSGIFNSLKNICEEVTNYFDKEDCVILGKGIENNKTIYKIIFYSKIKTSNCHKKNKISLNYDCKSFISKFKVFKSSILCLEVLIVEIYEKYLRLYSNRRAQANDFDFFTISNEGFNSFIFACIKKIKWENSSIENSMNKIFNFYLLKLKYNEIKLKALKRELKRRNISW